MCPRQLCPDFDSKRCIGIFCVFVLDQYGFLVADTDIQRTIKLINVYIKTAKAIEHNLNKHLFYILLGWNPQKRLCLYDP